MNYGTIYNKSTYPEIEATSIMFEANKIINSDPWLHGNCNGYTPAIKSTLPGCSKACKACCFSTSFALMDEVENKTALSI